MTRTDLRNIREWLSGIRLPQSWDEADWIAHKVNAMNDYFKRAGCGESVATGIAQSLDPQYRGYVVNKGETIQMPYCTPGAAEKIRAALLVKMDELLTREPILTGALT